MSRYRAVVLLLLAALGAALGQSMPGVDPDTSGWTAPGGPATPADSLAVFRPDSIRDGAIRGVESAPSPFARPRTAADSVDSVAAALRGRRPSLSVHLGVSFFDLDAKDLFASAVARRRAADTSLQVLQGYESVHLAFPAGVQALLPAGPWFDLVAKTLSYWYRQTAVLGRRAPLNSETAEEQYALQAHLGGVGLRYYIPPDLLSVKGNLGLYVQGVYYWLLGGTEIYGSHGMAKAEFDPAGSAWEVQLGYNHAVRKSWSLSGSLGWLSQDYASDQAWTEVLPSAVAPAGKAHWGGGALQASFHLAYHFGVPSRSLLPTGATRGAVPPTPTPTPAPSR